MILPTAGLADFTRLVVADGRTAVVVFCVGSMMPCVVVAIGREAIAALWTGGMMARIVSALAPTFAVTSRASSSARIRFTRASLSFRLAAISADDDDVADMNKSKIAEVVEK